MSWGSEVRDNLRAAAESAAPLLGWLTVLFLYLGLTVWHEPPSAGEPPSSGAARLLVLLGLAVLAVHHLWRFFKLFLDAGSTGYFFGMIALIVFCNLAFSTVWNQTESVVYYVFAVPLNKLVASIFGIELGEEMPQKTATLLLATAFLGWVLHSVEPMKSLTTNFRRVLCLDPFLVRIVSQIQVRRIVPSTHETVAQPPEPINAPGGVGRNPLVDPPGGPPALCP